MAYAGGIGQEIDQLKDLSVQELVRRQKLDPSLIYTIALQERQKMDAAGARQGVLDEPKPQGTVTGRMEQELAQQTMPQSPLNRMAPGVMQQGQRSMQPRGPQMAQGRQMAQGPQIARGISSVSANNMGAIGRAGGGIIGYADGGDVGPTLYDEMGKQYLPGQDEMPDNWQTLSNRDPMGPLDPAGGEFADELGRMERTRRERSTRTIPEFLSDLSGSQLTESKAGEILRSPIPAILKGQVERGIISEQEAANKIQKILSGPKGMGQRRQWNKENPDFLSQLEAMKESRERVLDAQEEGMAGGGIVGYAPGGEINPEMERLLDALMMAESGGDPDAVSRAGAEGLYQIMPSTGREPGFNVEPLGDAFDPQESRRFARDYLQAMLDRYDGDVEAALIAYNAGFGNADKFIAADRDLSALPRRGETEPYVRKIMGQLEKEDRRRDFRTGGGRSISTTAEESYTERTRRERLENQEAALASLYPPVAMEEAEMYEPNLPDALAVAQAMDSLSGGAEEAPVIAGFPTQEETDKAFTDAGLSGYGDGSRIRQRGRTGPEEVEEVEEESRELTFGGGRNITTTLPESFTEQSTRERREANAPAEGIAGYLQNIGRQQQLRRDDFRRAVPGAEAAVARAEQEKEDGGIGYLRRLGRLQEQAAQRQAEEAERALKSILMLQRNNDDVMGIDPAEKGTGQAYTQQTMPIQKFEKGGSPSSYGGGSMGNLGEYAEMAVNWATENPVDALATGLMFIPGIGWGAAAGAKGIALTARVAGPILKKYGTTAGQKLIQGIKTLGTKAVTKPNPAAVPRVGNKPGQITKGKVQPTQSVRGPDGRMQAGPPGRVVDPLRIAGGTGVGIKAGQALFDGEDEATEPTTQLEYFQELARKQEEAGTVEAFRAEQRAQRNQTSDKTGIAGALDKAKPLGNLALRLAEVLGRGAGASEGFEGAKILEESRKLRSEEAAIQLRRDQIAATTGQTEIRANATIDAMIGKAVADYTEGLTGGYQAAITAKAAEKGLEEGDPRVSAAVIKDYVTMLRSTMGSSMQGLGGSMQGLGGGGLSAADQALIDQYAPSN